MRVGNLTSYNFKRNDPDHKHKEKSNIFNQPPTRLEFEVGSFEGWFEVVDDKEDCECDCEDVKGDEYLKQCQSSMIFEVKV